MDGSAAPGAHKWMIVLPPEGAARQVGEKTWGAFAAALPGRCKLFDTKTYLDGFDKLLRDPGDDMVVDLANQSLVVQCLDFQATHVLVLALSPITFFTVNLLKRQGITTVHWFYEDFRQAKYWRGVLPAYARFFAIQRGEVEAACRDSGTAYAYLATAATLPLDRPPRPWRDRSHDLAFVGFPSPYRVAVLEALAHQGVTLQVAGAGWEKYRGPLQPLVRGGWAGPEAAARLLETSRIGLHVPFEDPAADRGHCHVSPRVFDILGSGCLLLCEEAPWIRETLPGFTYREFLGPEGAVRAAFSSLENAPTLQELTANQERIRREHTYSRRVAAILAQT